MRTVPLAALLSLAAVLLGALGLELGTASRDDEAAPSSSLLTPAASRNDAPASSIPDETREARSLGRPAFNWDRRPVAAPRIVGDAAPDVPRLTGIVVQLSTRLATFALPDGGRLIVAREGTRVGSFTVQAIQAGQVTVLGPDGLRVLRPSIDPHATPGAVPGGALGAQASPGPPISTGFAR